MNLGDILSLETIVPDLHATNRWEAIDQLIENLVATHKIQPGNRDAIVAVVKKRESSMSTGIGFGIGIPHASTDLIQEVVGALGRSTRESIRRPGQSARQLGHAFPRAAGTISKTSSHSRQHRQASSHQGISTGTGTGPRCGGHVRPSSKSIRRRNSRPTSPALQAFPCSTKFSNKSCNKPSPRFCPAPPWKASGSGLVPIPSSAITRATP